MVLRLWAMDSLLWRRLTGGMSNPVHTITIATALGCGLVAGVCFAFSAFVLPGLDRLAPPDAIAAMQSINRSAVTPVFMLALLGTAIACVGLAGWAISAWGRPGARLVLVGAVLYLVGMMIVTIAANLPLNDTLELVHADVPGAASDWSSFVTSWSAFNHLRTVMALAAATVLTLAVSSE